MDYSFSVSEVLVTILTLVVAGFGFIINEQREKIKSIRNQLSEKKYILYNDVFSIFFDLIKGQKNLKQSSESELALKIIDIKKDLFIYAPDQIVKKFIEWNTFISNNPNDITHARIFLQLFVLIRKDMGHRRTKINEEHILRSIMLNDTEYEKMKAMISLKAIR